MENLDWYIHATELKMTVEKLAKKCRNREHQSYMEYRKLRYEYPDDVVSNLISIATEIRRGYSEDPNKVEMKDLFLKIEEQEYLDEEEQKEQEEQQRKQYAEMSAAMWKSRLGVGKNYVNVPINLYPGMSLPIIGEFHAFGDKLSIHLVTEHEDRRVQIFIVGK